MSHRAALWIMVAYAISNVIGCIYGRITGYGGRPEPMRWVVGLVAAAALLG